MSLGNLPSARAEVAHPPGSETSEIVRIPPHARSAPYRRPAAAEYFWWDGSSEVRTVLRFADGTSREVSSEDSFSKRIEEVVFVNPTDKEAEMKLYAQY